MKIASFTFDDGLINTARKIKNIQIPSTFYLVTGWLLNTIEISDVANINCDHGSIKEWIELEVDIGCHTHNHSKNYNDFESFKIFSNIFKPPYHLSTPYGIIKTSKCFDTCKVGFNKPFFNLKTKKSLKCLTSVNPLYDFENHDSFVNFIKTIPENCWLILTFHGINEGWMPTNESYLKEVFNFLIEQNFHIKTMTEVVKEIKI